MEKQVCYFTRWRQSQCSHGVSALQPGRPAAEHEVSLTGSCSGGPAPSRAVGSTVRCFQLKLGIPVDTWAVL